MKITIRDIARECRVSPFTVSSVINNKRSISEETRTRVMEVIDRLGYDPASNVPHARNKKIKTIGLVVPIIQGSQNWFFSRAMTAAKEATYQAGLGYNLMSEEELVRMVLENFHAGSSQLQCDGIILFTPWNEGMNCIDRLRSWKVPVALVRRQYQGRGVITVTDNDEAGTTLACEHLHSLGHRAVCYVTTGHGAGDIAARRNAFRAFLRTHAMIDDPRLIIDEDECGRDVGSRIRELRTAGLPVTAVFATNDLIATRVIRTCIKAGLRVPEDVAVTGYNDDQIAHDFYPSITTVHVPAEKMVAEAVKALNGFDPESAASNIELKFENRLEIRESTINE